MNLLKHILFLLLLLINFLDYFAEYFLNTLGSLILFTHTVVQEFIGLNTFPDILLGHISFIFYTISNSFTKNGRSRSRDFSSNFSRQTFKLNNIFTKANFISANTNILYFPSRNYSSFHNDNNIYTININSTPDNINFIDNSAIL